MPVNGPHKLRTPFQVSTHHGLSNLTESHNEPSFEPSPTAGLEVGRGGDARSDMKGYVYGFDCGVRNPDKIAKARLNPDEDTYTPVLVVLSLYLAMYCSMRASI